MSFYGNISNAGRTELKFDKIYPNRKQMEAQFNSDNIFVGRYVLVEYDDNTFTRFVGYSFDSGTGWIYSDDTRQLPFLISKEYDATDSNSYPFIIGDLVKIEENNQVEYYVCIDKNNDTPSKAIFSRVTDDSSNDYLLNYNIDKQWAINKNVLSDFERAQGWDSTIWERTLNGYVMIGRLNSKTPVFTISAEAPTIEPIAPHFSENSTNEEYNLHVQAPWGMRVKPAINDDPSDETVDYGEQEYNGAIYYNKEGFNPEIRSKIDDLNDEVSLLPTGSSGRKYIDHNAAGSQYLTEQNDIQELKIHLPSIGNAVSDLWDVMYGTNRNLDIDWGSTEGNRMVNLTDGGFSYEPEKTQTVSGAINSIHDLMGMIVEENVDLEEANTEKIYYRSVEIENEGEMTKRTGYYIKVPKCEYEDFPTDPDQIFHEVPSNELNENKKYYFKNENNQYEVFKGDLNNLNGIILYENDIDNFINQRQYFNLTEYRQEDGYYTRVNENYYKEIKENFTPNTAYYKIENPDRIYLKPWEESEELPEDLQNINHYYEEANKVNNVEYINYKRGKTSNHKEIYYTISANAVEGKIYNPEMKTQENGNILSGYIYYYRNKRTNKISSRPVQQVNTVGIGENPYPEITFENDPDTYERVYYYLDEYKIANASNQGEAVSFLAYAFQDEDKNDIPINQENLPSKFNIPEVNMLQWTLNTYYYLDGDNNFISLTSDTDPYSDENKNYYTIGKVKETGDNIKIDDNTNTTGSCYYYEPGRYYYLQNGVDYIFSTDENMPTGEKEWYELSEKSIKSLSVIFYEPNKYYYELKDSDNNITEIFDSSTSMKQPGGQVEGKTVQSNESLEVYYQKRHLYVKNDTSGILSAGSVWNSGYPVPSTITLGTLYKDNNTIGQTYEWKELIGFSRTLNTINGLIVKLNQFFKFDDTLTRDRDTIQGCLNNLNDLINDFGKLVPGEIAVIDEYGRLKSAEIFTKQNTDSDSWISVDVDNSVTNTKITISHNDPKESEAKKFVNDEQTPNFGKTFNIINGLAVDDKGHVYLDNCTIATVTIPKGELKSTELNNKNKVLTEILFEDETGKINVNYQDVGTLKLTGYEKLIVEDPTDRQADISAEDTLNQALKKLDQFTLNEAQALDSEQSRAEGVEEELRADLDAEIARAKDKESTLQTNIDNTNIRIDLLIDNDTIDLDSIVELVKWINTHSEKTEEIIAAITDNEKDIESNDIDIEKLQTDLAATNTELSNINNSLIENINNVNTTLSGLIAENKAAIEDNGADIIAINIKLDTLVGTESVSKQIENAITAQNLSQYATTDTVNALTERIETLEEAGYQTAAQVENIYKEKIEYLETTIANLLLRIEALENPTE